MNMNSTITEKVSKHTITQYLVEAMKDDPEIRQIIVFGSFLHSENPGDIDVAVRGSDL
jgi:predicted nucleotidyltransferase